MKAILIFGYKTKEQMYILIKLSCGKMIHYRTFRVFLLKGQLRVVVELLATSEISSLSLHFYKLEPEDLTMVAHECIPPLLLTDINLHYKKGKEGLPRNT